MNSTETKSINQNQFTVILEMLHILLKKEQSPERKLIKQLSA